MADQKSVDVIVSPTELEVGGLQSGHVGLRFHTEEIEALLPSADLIVRLSPEEARDLAGKLVSWAALVEGKPSPSRQ